MTRWEEGGGKKKGVKNPERILVYSRPHLISERHTHLRKSGVSVYFADVLPSFTGYQAIINCL